MSESLMSVAKNVTGYSLMACRSVTSVILSIVYC